MAFELLSERVRKYIRDKRWEELRPIQVAAIQRIMTTDANYILASRTASGKTEAAFLPIISKLDFNEVGVQVLYISPLVALINDQFYRIEELCKNLEITVTKWHGEANKTLKERLIKEPNGIVLITPESLEAMFANKSYNVKHLFSNLKYVVVDEIHSFLGNDRGTQLKSILSRLQDVNPKPFNIVGLSATIGDYNEAKKFTGNPDNTKVLLDRSAKDIEAIFKYFKKQADEIPLNLLKDVYIETKNSKALIFPNSRGRAEEVAVILKKLSERLHGHPNYFSHHSSVNKEVREFVEYFAKNNNRQNFCISCTSTLELGIDIGTVDQIVQIDATHSISSLIQRAGRSGRKDNEKSHILFYATEQWSLLQTLACWLLYKEGFIEPPLTADHAYDILLHQALSIVKSRSGIKITELIKQLKHNFAFNQIEVGEIEEIVNHLIDIDFLEKLRDEVIIGVEGEKIVNGRDFYAVFKSEENFKVVFEGKIIGEIPFSPQIIEDENILLAAKTWKIVNVDFKAKKIEVVQTHEGKKPVFLGGSQSVHPRIREKMFEILFTQNGTDILNPESLQEIETMRADFTAFDIQNLDYERPFLQSLKNSRFITFTGTRINRTLALLFSVAGIRYYLEENLSSFELDITADEFKNKWKVLVRYIKNIDSHILELIESKPALMDFSKYGFYLPKKYQIKLMHQKYFDFEGAEKFIKEVSLVNNTIF